MVTDKNQTTTATADELVERAAAAYQNFNDPEDGLASHTWNQLAPLIKRRRRRWMRAALAEIGIISHVES